MTDRVERDGRSRAQRDSRQGSAPSFAGPPRRGDRQRGDHRPRGGPRGGATGGVTSLPIQGELLYGRNGVSEALRGRRRLHQLFLADGIHEDERIGRIRDLVCGAGVPISQVPRAALDDATHGANHQGVGLDAGPYQYVEVDDVIAAEGTVLMLDHLQDPQNIGTLLRAAEASGAAGVILPTDRTATITPAVVNASAGAVELLAVTRIPNLARAIELAKQRGRWAIGLEDDERAVDLFLGDLPVPALLIVGAEGPGIGPNLRRYCDVLARIPMSGRVASLNASTAGSIALFELWRRSRVAG